MRRSHFASRRVDAGEEGSGRCQLHDSKQVPPVFEAIEHSVFVGVPRVVDEHQGGVLEDSGNQLEDQITGKREVAHRMAKLGFADDDVIAGRRLDDCRAFASCHETTPEIGETALAGPARTSVTCPTGVFAAYTLCALSVFCP